VVDVLPQGMFVISLQMSCIYFVVFVRLTRSAERPIDMRRAVPYVEQKGRPVNIEFFGGLNLPELYKHITPEKLVESIIVTADALTREVLPAASRAAGRHIEQSVVIVNLEGFG
jgi:hypothetical protein